MVEDGEITSRLSRANPTVEEVVQLRLCAEHVPSQARSRPCAVTAKITNTSIAMIVRAQIG
jgi:hypothetical protein